jgi:hypothetical protein
VRGRFDTKAIADECARKRGLGHEYMLLAADTGNSPRNWERAIIARGRPSLIGRCIGAGKWPGQWIFDVRLDVVEAWLVGVEKVRTESECHDPNP